MRPARTLGLVVALASCRSPGPPATQAPAPSATVPSPVATSDAPAWVAPAPAVSSVATSDVKPTVEPTTEERRPRDGEARRSAHRGTWRPSAIGRHASALDGYVASAKPGNAMTLGTAASPFASYLNAMHQRVHPIFVDGFLASLDGLAADHALNHPNLRTVVEIVLEPSQGRLVRMGILRASGVTVFDIAALDTLDRAAPFGAAPAAIVSADGKVYVHWEFHRDPDVACSTRNARPLLLATP